MRSGGWVDAWDGGAIDNTAHERGRSYWGGSKIFSELLAFPFLLALRLLLNPGPDRSQVATRMTILPSG